MSSQPTPTPQVAFDNVVQGTTEWANNQNLNAIAEYHNAWPSYVQAVQISKGRGGLNMPPALLPALVIHVIPTSVEAMMRNEPAVNIVYGNSPTDYVCTPNELPSDPPVQTGGVGKELLPGSPGWFQALIGDTTPNGTTIFATTSEGISGLFQKYDASFGSGVFKKVN